MESWETVLMMSSDNGWMRMNSGKGFVGYGPAPPTQVSDWSETSAELLEAGSRGRADGFKQLHETIICKALLEPARLRDVGVFRNLNYGRTERSV